jgi:hypothetical protein
MECDLAALTLLSDDELLRQLNALVVRDRLVEADLVAHIGEVDARGLYARQAFPSMFAYCTQCLHLSEAEAYRRITVARASRRFPVLLAMLRDGRLHLSGIATLVPLLTDDNVTAVLVRATHKTKRQIEELVAELAPRHDAPCTVRKLPERVKAATTFGQEAAPIEQSDALPRAELVPGRVAAETEPTPPSNGAATASFQGRTVAGNEPSQPAITRRQPAAVVALSPARHRVQFTVSTELRDKLERLAVLMRAEAPDGDLGRIIEVAVTEKLARLETRRFGAAARVGDSPSPADTRWSAPASAKTRHIPAAVRHAVSRRDQGRCGFVDAQGRRCSERHRVEFHHRRPFGLGGDHTVDNIGLLCPAHNRHIAELDYGCAAIGPHRRSEPAGEGGRSPASPKA